MWEPQLASLGRAAADRRPAPPRLRGNGGTRGPHDGAGGRALRPKRSTRPASTRRSCAGSRWAATSRSSSGGPRGRASRPWCSRTPGPSPTRRKARPARRALAERLRKEGHGFLVEEPPPLLAEDAPAELARARESDDRRPDAGRDRGRGPRDGGASGFRAGPPGIDVPTLVITGTADRLIPPDVTAGIAGRVPGAELLRIEGAGHLSNLEAPEAFNTALGRRAERRRRCSTTPSRRYGRAGGPPVDWLDRDHPRRFRAAVPIRAGRLPAGCDRRRAPRDGRCSSRRRPARARPSSRSSRSSEPSTGEARPSTRPR